jgi:DegV family protein with EDD domain
MKDYILSVDSTTPITEKQKKDYGIISTGLTYTLDGKESVDAFKSENDKSSFYQKLINGAKAQSSKVSPSAFLKNWRPILEKGKNILHLSLSAKVSGSYDSACMAANELMEEYPESIEVVDSTAGSFCVSKMAIEAVELQEKNWSIKKIIEKINVERKKYNLLFTVNDINHLYRGGRISHVKAIIGGALKLKPMIHVTEKGVLGLLGNARGLKKAYTYIVDKIAASTTKETSWAYIAHGGDETHAKVLKELIQEKLAYIKKIDIGVLSPVLGLHAGPGALAVCFKGKDRQEMLKT